MAPATRVRAFNFAALAAMLLPSALAQTCATINPTYPAPALASGVTAKIVMNGLKTPRQLVFDTAGNLLVSEQGGGGIRQIILTDNGGVNVCVKSSKTIVSDATLNHGLALSADGKTLYASSVEAVYAYTYDAAAGTATNRKTIISGMTNAGHNTRTLLIPKNNPNLLLVSRGSNANIDSPTTSVSTPRSQIRIFDLSKITNAVTYDSGTVLGWGLRNSVGVGEDPTNGAIWSVENSVDNMQRQGKDVHNTNPGEEMNYHGILNDTASPERGKNFGYPDCFSVFDPSVMPTTGFAVGQQIAINTPSGSITDDFCKNQRQAPRLTFPAHTAPLDIKFKTDGSSAFISFHGSWNRSPPDGYRLSRIQFSGGQPTAPTTSTNAAVNIMWNNNNGGCPNSCFRPCGLVFDSKGRLFMTSDSTGEIYVLSGV